MDVGRDRGGARWGWRGNRSRLTRALEVPEDAAAEQKQQREDRQLAARDLPLAAVAVVPGEDECDGETDEKCEAGEPLHLHGPVEKRADVCKSLLESPRAGGIGQPPLHQLPAAQSGPHDLPQTAVSRCRSLAGCCNCLSRRLRQLHLAQECLEAGSSAMLLNSGSPSDFDQSQILLLVRSFEPFECEIVIAAIRIGLSAT